jgi:hypothetical protein
MANSSEGARRAAHLRYHAKPGILKADCVLCQLVAQASGNPFPTVPDPPKSVETVRRRLEIAGKLVEFDVNRLRGMAARQRTLAEVSLIFGMSEAELEAEIQQAWGLSWDQLASRAPIALFDEAEAALWRLAIDGDARFMALLISLGRLPGWDTAHVQPIPALQATGRHLPSGSHEPLPPIDLRNMSTADLNKWRQENKRKALESVIDAPSTAQRLEANQSPTLEITDATELPSGWIRAQDGRPIVEGCEDSYEIAQKERI